MKLLPILVPLLRTVLTNETENQAGSSPEKEKMAEKLADTMEEIPNEKPNFRNLNDSRAKFGKIDWENVYFEDTLDILGPKKAGFQIKNVLFSNNAFCSRDTGVKVNVLCGSKLNRQTYER